MSLRVLLFLSIYSICALGTLFNPILGVCGYLFTYFIFCKKVWWGQILTRLPIRYSYLMALLLFVGMIFQKNKINWVVRPYNKLEILFYLFVGIIGLSLIIGLPPDAHSYYLFEKMFKVSFFLFMLIRVVNTVKNYNLVIFTIITTGIFLGVEAFLSPYSRFVGGRLDLLGGSDFTGANEFSIHLAAVLCFLGISILKTKNWPLRVFYIIGSAFVLNGIILTRARGTFLAMIGAAIYAILFSPKKWRMQIFVYSVLGIILFFQLADPTFIQRVSTIKNYKDDPSAISRPMIWKASIKMLKDYPLGIGVGNFHKVIGNYDERIEGKDAHNTFVRCYGELGIQGLTVFIIIIFLVLQQLRRIKILINQASLDSKIKLDPLALSLAIVIYLIGGLTHTRLYIEDMWLLFGMSICLEKAILNEIRLKARSNIWIK